jgi:hypothetical protein
MKTPDPTPRRFEQVRPAVSTTPELPIPRNSVDTGAPAPPPPDCSAGGTSAKRARKPRVRRFLTEKKCRIIVATAMLVPVIGLSADLATSSIASAAQSASSSHAAGAPESEGTGSNARSAPAAGGSSGAVTSVSDSGFTMTTSAGQKVSVETPSSTKYGEGSGLTTASAVKKGTHVLVLGTVDSTTVKATQVVVQTTGSSGAAASTAATVVPFQKGAPTTSKEVGQIPVSYTEGSGTIVSGTTATRATEAALAAYPGGIVNWPHHIFVTAPNGGTPPERGGKDRRKVGGSRSRIHSRALERTVSLAAARRIEVAA